MQEGDSQSVTAARSRFSVNGQSVFRGTPLFLATFS
jgi:hypothetical protein